MGRLGPLASLALGRSPFEAPELDESGNCILGPHAHDFENTDHYLQQFDSRGHPQNKASKSVTRAMEHAQNTVLETVGVVIKKDEENKNDWQRQNNMAKFKEIFLEDTWAARMIRLSPFLTHATTWWLLGARFRYQTFYSCSEIPLLQAIAAERRLLGPQQFFLTGLLPSMTSFAVRSIQQSVQEKLQLQATSTFKVLLSNLGFHVLNMPIQAFALLKILDMIPHASVMGISSLVPFTRSSPIQLENWPRVWSWNSLFRVGIGASGHPFLLSMLNEYLFSFLQPCIYRVVILTIAERPDRPDLLTQRASKFFREQNVLYTETGPFNSVEILAEGRSTDFWTEIKHEARVLMDPLPWLEYLKALYRTFGMSFTDRIKNAETRCMELYLEKINDLRFDDFSFRDMQSEAVRAALQQFLLTDNLPGCEVDDFLMRVLGHLESRSTATPEPINLLDIGANPNDREDHRRQFTGEQIDTHRARQQTSYSTHPQGSQRGFQSPSNEANASTSELTGHELRQWSSESEALSPVVWTNSISDLAESESSQLTHPANSLWFTTVPAELQADSDSGLPDISTLFQSGNDSSHETDPLQPRSSPSHPLSPNTATPAPSTMMNREAFHPPTPPQMVIRSEISMDTLELAIRRRSDRHNAASRANSPGWNFPDIEMYADIDTAPRHRVTSLTVRPASAAALFTSSIIASAIMLPLSSLYLRSLVFGFLASPANQPGAVDAAMGIKGDVIGLGAWFGGGNGGWMGRVRYAGVMTLALGLEGVIGSLVWGAETGLVVWLGRTKTGWGQF